MTDFQYWEEVDYWLNVKYDYWESERQEARHEALAEAAYEVEQDAVWCVVAFLVCFGAGDRFVAVDAFVEALATFGADAREQAIAKANDPNDPNYIPF